MEAKVLIRCVQDRSLGAFPVVLGDVGVEDGSLETVPYRCSAIALVPFALVVAVQLKLVVEGDGRTW